MSPKKDMVVFEMADGTEVSNDPEFGLLEALEKSLDSEADTGDAGVPLDEQEAVKATSHLASLNSGQPGVGENATLEDPTGDLYGPLGPPAHREQKDDAKEAAEAGNTPSSPAFEAPEPVDVNERVIALRKEKDEAREAYQKAVDKLGEEGPGDPNEPYSDWSAVQLKAEIARRNADPAHAGPIIKLTGGMKKSDAARLLDEDDAAQDAGAGPGTVE